ncbi:MAG: dienelactone hydrolase family protein [Sphingomonadales bacterium]|nr:dienelactone hydrolase family protein [Sphingomonadales bacterium]
MCDEFTAGQEDAALSGLGLNRRQFAAAGIAASVAACADAGVGDGQGVVESMVLIPTVDGTCDAWFVHPRRGRFPAVIMWPDIAGLRDAYKTMGKRLAQAGYAVLVVNHYYRTARAPLLASMAEWRTPEGQAKLQPAIAAINPAGTTRDATSFVAWLDKQGAVDTRKGIGTCGYCMGGPYALRTAAAAPGRVRAAASLHGANLVTPGQDSPHLSIPRSKASFLLAIARNDDARSPADKSILVDTAKVAHRPAEVEVYHADHGWCTIDAPVYDKTEAERAWARMLVLFKGL